MRFGIRWRGQKEQIFCCPNCATVFRSKYYDIREPKGAMGAFGACKMFVKNCPNCGILAQVADLQQTRDGFL